MKLQRRVRSLRSRNVADDVTRTEIAGQRFQPLDIHLELAAPCRRRDVHRVEGRLVHDAVDRQAVTRLEAAHRLLEIGIIDVVLDRAGMGIEIARDREPLTQFAHARMMGTEPQFQNFRHFRPASTGNDAVVDLDRAPRGFRRPW